jgi:LEA14-like dessication related protein
VIPVKIPLRKVQARPCKMVWNGLALVERQFKPGVRRRYETAQDGTTKTYTVTVMLVRQIPATINKPVTFVTPSYSPPEIVVGLPVVPWYSMGVQISKVEVKHFMFKRLTSLIMALFIVSAGIIPAAVLADGFPSIIIGSPTTPEGPVKIDLMKDLTLSRGTLKPAFNVGTPSYVATVANDVSSITVTPTVFDNSGATVTVNGEAVASGKSSSAINLNEGFNFILVVASTKELIETTYTLTVTRAGKYMLSGLTLSRGSLIPAFSSDLTRYWSLVDGSVDNITVTPTVSDSSATVTVNGITVPSGSPSSPIHLNPGSNSIIVLVKAPDGTEKRNVVNLVRDVKPDLSGLLLSSGTLTPPFGTVETRWLDSIIDSRFSSSIAPPVTSTISDYTANVDYSVNSITVTPTLADRNASVTVNGVAVMSGSPSDPINLNVGSNKISVEGTAGELDRLYTVTVMRARNTKADLSGLALLSGSLTPAFNSEVTGYKSIVDHSMNSITVTPTVKDSNATVTVNGIAVTNGSPSDAISLNEGSNTVTIVVTADDGTTKTYTLTVIRPGPAKLYINGALQDPLNLVNDNIMVPVGTVTDLFGATSMLTDFNGSKMVDIKLNDKHIMLSIGKNKAMHFIGNSFTFVDLPEKTYMDESGTIQVPFRFLFEALGGKVGYDAETNTYTVTANRGTTGMTQLYVNGLSTEWPAIVNGHAMVSLRLVSEGLGADVGWDADTKTITIKSGDTTVIVTIDKDVGTVNGEEKSLEEKPFLNEYGKSMVPLRFIFEALHAKVEYNAETNTIFVTK